QYSSDLVKGRTRPEILADIRAKLFPFIRGLIPMADDDVLVAYDGLLVDQYLELKAKDPTSCYLYASGEGGHHDLVQSLSEALIKRELSLQEKVVMTAKWRPPGEKALIESLWTSVRETMTRDGTRQSDFELLEASNLEKSKHGVYCSVAINLFKKIGQLPQGQ